MPIIASQDNVKEFGILVLRTLLEVDLFWTVRISISQCLCQCGVIYTMDLNASPLPEGDEVIYDERLDKHSALQELRVTATETMHQDTDGRHPRMKRKHPDEDSIHVSQRFMNNQESQFRNNGYDRNSLPSGSAGTGSTEVSPMETPARVVSQNLRQDDIDPDNMTYELILATKPDAEHGKSPNIMTEDNIKLLFEIQKKKIKIRRRAIATVGTELKGFSLHIFIDAL